MTTTATAAEHDHPNYQRCGTHCPASTVPIPAEMRTIEDVIADTFAIKPLIVDEYPVDYDEGSINIYLRKGDDAAIVAITDHASDYDPDEFDEGDEPAAPVVGIDLRLIDDELLALAKTCVKTLAAMGDRDHIAELVAEAAQTLADIR